MSTLPVKRRLVLCKQMLNLSTPHNILYPALWELILSYLNEYKHQWNAVNLEYRSALTCQKFSSWANPRPGQWVNELCYLINNHPLSDVDRTYETKLYQRSRSVRNPMPIPPYPWYTRPITCRKRHFCTCYDGEILIMMCGSESRGDYETLRSEGVSINSVEGRQILTTYKLEPFFEGYIQPEGCDEPVEVPTQVWDLGQTWTDDLGAADGGYEGLKASIRELNLPPQPWRALFRPVPGTWNVIESASVLRSRSDLLWISGANQTWVRQSKALKKPTQPILYVTMDEG